MVRFGSSNKKVLVLSIDSAKIFHICVSFSPNLTIFPSMLGLQTEQQRQLGAKMMSRARGTKHTHLVHTTSSNALIKLWLTPLLRTLSGFNSGG